jgi:CheY-like chemotaxis protein
MIRSGCGAAGVDPSDAVRFVCSGAALGGTMPKTLLLADDSVTIQKVVGISFANEDIVLLTVDNGDDAIVRCRDSRPDIVLADVVMPGKNGYDVCQTIKSDPSLAHIPVLLLTGTFEAFDEQRAARAGADGHITKPFEAQALVDQVNGLLSRPAPSAGAPAEAAAAPAKAARPAPPQPVSHTADTAYDFFDDEATATRDDRRDPQEATATFGAPPVAAPAAVPAFVPPAPAPAFSAPTPEPDLTPSTPTFTAPPAPAAAAATAFGNDALDVDSSFSGESLFDDFGNAAEAPTMTAAPRVDPTPSDPIGWGARSSEPQNGDSFDWDVRGDEATGTATSEWDAPAEPAAADNVIDFEANTQPDPPATLGGWDLASDPAPVLRSDPSEVPDWFTPASEPASASYPPEVAAAAPAPVASFDVGEASFDVREPSSGGFDLEASLDEGSAYGDAVIDPHGARDYDVSSSDLGAPVVLAPLVEPPAPMPAPAAAPSPAVSFGAPSAPSFASAPAAAPAAALPERDRREIHDALEKVAWEAFGPVAESLVREAVERIERIAWEVIPQLAESLIKEEIRKLKGE